MKTLTVRLPIVLANEITEESVRRRISKSDVVRERLTARRIDRHTATIHAIADLVGCVDDLPKDLSSRRKAYLAQAGYGRKRAR